MVGLRFTDLTKSFGETIAVDNISLEVADGMLTTFLGPSGCGKTTTLRMVAGLAIPTSGRIYIGDDVVYSGGGVSVPAEKRRIGMVFQSYAVWPHMNVFENVAFPLRVRRIPRNEVREMTHAALQKVRLRELAERFPAELSGGQQQRVALARAIVFEPRILLLDEPLSNLDAKLREQMRAELRELQQQLRITTIFVTHDQDEALALSDVVAVMDKGKIIQTGSPETIYERPATRFVADFVGWKNLFKCEVADGETIVLDGKHLRCRGIDDPVPGSAATVAIRPGDVEILTENPGDETNVVSAQVRSSMYMGGHRIFELAFGEDVLVSHAPAANSFDRNSVVRVRLPADRLLVFRD